MPDNKEGMRRLLYFYVEDQIKRRWEPVILLTHLSTCLRASARS